jgi:hypothetical protein
MSRVFAAYSVGGLIGPALGAFGGIHGPFLTPPGPAPARGAVRPPGRGTGRAALVRGGSNRPATIRTGWAEGLLPRRCHAEARAPSRRFGQADAARGHGSQAPLAMSA